MAWWISAISSDSFKTVAPTQTHTHICGEANTPTNCQIIRLFNVDSSLVAGIILLTAALSNIGAFLENKDTREVVGGERKAYRADWRIRRRFIGELGVWGLWSNVGGVQDKTELQLHPKERKKDSNASEETSLVI